MKRLLTIATYAFLLLSTSLYAADDLEFVSLTKMGSWDPSSLEPGESIGVFYSIRRSGDGPGATLRLTVTLDGNTFVDTLLSVASEYLLSPAGSPPVSVPTVPGNYTLKGCIKYEAGGDDDNPNNDCIGINLRVNGDVPVLPPTPTGANGVVDAGSIVVQPGSLEFAINGVDNGCGGISYRTPDTASTYAEMYVAVLQSSATSKALAPDTLSCAGAIAITQSFTGL